MLLYASLLMNAIALVAGIITIAVFFSGPSEEELKLEKEVYSFVNSACHSWKNAYISLVPDHFSQYGEEYGHVWEMLLKVEPPRYSEVAWQRYFPLFDERANYVRNELNRLLATHSDIIPFELRALIEVTNISIETEQLVYQRLPSMLRPTDDKNVFFQVRFQSMIRALSKLSREAERLKHKID